MTDTEALKALVAKWRKQADSLRTENPDFSDGLSASRDECADDLESTLERMLASQLNNPEAEAVAYLYSKDGFDQVVLAEMAYPKMREELISEGWTIAPLYRSPPAALSPDKLMGLVRKWRKDLREVDSDRDNYSPPSADYFADQLEEALLSQEDKQ